jgi:hypothetical protein
MYKYIISSGWFSDPNNKTKLGSLANNHQKKYGGTISRNKQFSKYWLSHILNQSILPQKIYILDANSPEKIDESVKKHNLVDISKQIKNFGHGVYCSKNNILCGWARGFIYGATQAYLNDCDFVYVEQDLLLFGKEFIENIFDLLNKKDKKICYLNGDETPQKLQQSFVVCKYEYLPKLITNLINSTDHTISEELKHYNIIKNDVMWCPYRGGRQRKKLNSNYFCLQHMTYKEIEYYKKKNKIINIFI